MVVAFIPARSQSKRILGKNIYPLNGHPLLAYSIQSAKDSGIFDGIYVSSDSLEICALAEKYGAKSIHCPLEIAHKDYDPDYKWVKHAVNYLELKPDSIFSILRPTSPFRTGKTIKRAYKQFSEIDCDSLRAVELCKQHPYKMWKLEDSLMSPLFGFNMYSNPYQSLPKIYVQNASLEIAWVFCVIGLGSISGTRISPFLTQGYEGFDINEPYDLKYAEWLIETGKVKLPEISSLQHNANNH